MPKIKPRSAEDCIDFIKKHKAEIERGEYDLEIEPDWVKSFELSDIKFLIQFCPDAKIGIGKSPFTPTEILEVLSKDEYHVQKIVAGNTSTPIKILKTLAKQNVAGVREAVGRNSNTPVDILEVLSRDEDYGVRRFVAENSNTPTNILEVLSRDVKEYVRADVGRNANTPRTILEFLTKDEYYWVRASVGRNPSTPPNILELLSKDYTTTDGSYPVMAAVAGNTSTPIKILNNLVNGSEDVLLSLARNPSTPAKILKKIECPGYTEVSNAIGNNPNYRKPICFIATAVYGTPYAPEVVALKAFRDTKLTNNPLGRIFIECYYKYSPFIAKVIKNNIFIKSVIRVVFIDPLVRLVKINNWDKTK